MKSAYNLTIRQRKTAMALFFMAVVLLLVLAAGKLTSLAYASVNPEDAHWEAVIAARLFMFKVLVAVVLALGAPLLALGLFGVIDRSAIGPRLLHWREGDGEHLKSARKINGGAVFAALLLGVFWLAAACIR